MTKKQAYDLGQKQTATPLRSRGNAWKRRLQQIGVAVKVGRLSRVALPLDHALYGGNKITSFGDGCLFSLFMSHLGLLFHSGGCMDSSSATAESFHSFAV